MLLVGSGSGDSSTPSDSKLVNNVELFNVVDAAADSKTETANASLVDSSSEAAPGTSAVSNDAGVEKTRGGSSLALGLSTGHFDEANVKLLRTCSEPDLSRLSQPAAMMTRSSIDNSREGCFTHSSSQDSVHDVFSVAGVSPPYITICMIWKVDHHECNLHQFHTMHPTMIITSLKCSLIRG